jgi:hypothetical protein
MSENSVPQLAAPVSLLPGPKTGCLQILGGKFSQIEKNSAFFRNYIFTAKKDKINKNMAYFKNLCQRNLCWNFHSY